VPHESELNLSDCQLWCRSRVYVSVRATHTSAGLLAVLMAGLLPAAASASTFTVIPPSNSGANQYVEGVPTAGGSRPSIPVGAPGSASTPATRQTRSISPSTQAGLIHRGADGRRTAALARRFAPPLVSRRSRAHQRSGRSAGTGSTGAGSAGAGSAGGGSAGGGSAGGGSAGGGSSPLRTLVQALVGSGSYGASGALIPIALVLSALGVGVVALRRRSG
jgi:hypothetical protein